VFEKIRQTLEDSAQRDRQPGTFSIEGRVAAGWTNMPERCFSAHPSFNRLGGACKNLELLMSALGQERTCRALTSMSAFPPKANIKLALRWQMDID